MALGILIRYNVHVPLMLTLMIVHAHAHVTCMVVQVHDLKVELRNIKAGLHNTSRFIQEPKDLKEAIKALYRKHLQDYDRVK